MSAGPKQSAGMSLLESVINIGVGLGLGLIGQMVFLPLLGVEINLHQNLVFAGIMTVISIARSYALRRLFEALHIRAPLSPAMLAVIAERRRQIDGEGWTHEHDDGHEPGELARAGAAYALADATIPCEITGPDGCAVGEFNLGGNWFWPWLRECWKPQDFRRNLVKAGALILAEIEKFDRSRGRKAKA